MLKILRENLKSLAWVLWFVIIVFVLIVFAEVGTFDPQQAGGSSTVAAQGEGYKITYGEYERAYNNLEARYRDLLQDNFSPEMAEQLRIQALNQLIERKLILQEAERMDLRVTDEEIRRQILSYPVFTDENGRFVGREQYRVTLQRSGFATPADFEAQLREDLLVDKLDSALRSSVYVSPAEVEETFRNRVERASIRYVTLLDRAVADEVEVTDEDLAAYFAENQEDYRLPEQRVVGYLLVDKILMRQQQEVTDEEI